MIKTSIKSLIAICTFLSFLMITACQFNEAIGQDNHDHHQKKYEVTKSDAEWQKSLTAEQYYILRQKGTERSFTGKYNKFYKKGIYRCAGCGQILFVSDTKYDSKTGWPSFWQPYSEKNIELQDDNSLFTKRTEVLCNRCGSHLGHLFSDGPPSTGLRYCINSAALIFDDQPLESNEIPSELEKYKSKQSK